MENDFYLDDSNWPRSRRIYLCLPALFLLILLNFCCEVAKASSLDNQQRASSGHSLLRHFVAFKYKETATKQQIHEIEEALQSLKSKIPQVVSIEWGSNNSPEQVNKGFTDGFLITFRTKQDRDAYLVHPAHLKFKEKALPLIADVFVLDFCDKR